MRNFIDVECNTSNLDVFHIRSSIFRALQDALPLFNGRLLDIGCGKMPYKKHILEHSAVQDYVGLDIENALEYAQDVKADVLWDGKTMPLESSSFDCAFGTEVLEHCPEPEVVLKEVCRVLKPSGVFFFTVPFLWNLHEVPNDEYRYTPFSLTRHLEHSGFTEIELKATGGWHASMAVMLGLWVRRSPINARKKDILSTGLKPIIKYLIKKDKANVVTFRDGQMITGITGTAKKKVK